MSRRDTRFKLVVEEGYREESLFEGDSIEDILESASEKAGRGSFWEWFEDGN